MIRIEKGIAMPHKGSVLQKYPFGDMQPGDSIIGPPSIRTCACGWRERHPGFTYMARTEGPKKVRLWCVTQASMTTQAQTQAGFKAMRDAASGGTNATHDADVPTGEAA